MKILHMIPYLPAPATFGGALRIYHLLKHNYENHDLTITGFSDNGDLQAMHEVFPDIKNQMFFEERPFKKRFKRFIQALSLFSNHTSWYLSSNSKSFQHTLDDLVDKNDFDLIQNEFPFLGQHSIKSDAKTVMDAHNVEYDNFKRIYQLEESRIRKYFYKKEYEKCKREEIELAASRDAIFTTSRRDKLIFKSELPNKPIYVIPNGVDTNFFSPSSKETEPNSLVFTGMMGYVPNYDGINFFIDKVLPIIRQQVPDIKLYVVGKNPPKSVKERASDKIIVTGFVDDVRPYVHRSSVYVVPLRMGGGTRLKVLEALAMKKPVVSTSIGSEGIEVNDGEHVLIANEPEYFAECVLKLLKDKKKARQLTENGYELIQKVYEWKAIGEQMDKAYDSIVNSSPSENREKIKDLKVTL